MSHIEVGVFILHKKSWLNIAITSPVFLLALSWNLIFQIIRNENTTHKYKIKMA